MLLLGTTNPDDSPLINPVWYYFDTVKTKLYFYTEPDLKKTKNIRDRNIVYFDVDDEKWPYKGVKGKGRARILTAKNQALAVGKKILTRYVRKGLPLFNYAFEKMKSEEYIIIEITPTYFTSWDFGKLEDQKSLQQSIISS
jgi:nitroimidazol reductase NimA-like FMN-containing flavoprotein (pyridoxamine 5'-phosphate oxidase superfamily)